MATTTIYTNTTHFLELLVTDINGGVDGLSITYTISRSSDDVEVKTGTLTGIGGGLYKVGISLSTPGQYRVRYYGPAEYADEVEALNVIETETVEDTTTPEAYVRPDELAASKNNNYAYTALYNDLPGTVSSTFNLIRSNTASVVIFTTGQVDVLVSNDNRFYVTKANVYGKGCVDVSCYAYVKCIVVSGLGSASVCLKK